MLAEKIHEDYRFESDGRAGLSNIDFKKILKSDDSFAFVSFGHILAQAIIGGDGSVWLIEIGNSENDFSDLRLPEKDVLQNICAAESILDIFDDSFFGKHSLMPPVPVKDNELTLLGLSAGAKQSLGFSKDTPLSVIGAACQDFDPSPILRALKCAGASLSDPIFTPKDTKAWTEEEAESVLPVVRDILMASSKTSPAYYDLTASSHEFFATLTSDDGLDLSDPGIGILRELFDFDEKFTGEYFEYNDGAHARESGYYSSEAVILTIELSAAPSEHERIAAIKRLTDRLTTASVPKDVSNDLIQALR